LLEPTNHKAMPANKNERAVLGFIAEKPGKILFKKTLLNSQPSSTTQPRVINPRLIDFNHFWAVEPVFRGKFVKTAAFEDFVFNFLTPCNYNAIRITVPIKPVIFLRIELYNHFAFVIIVTHPMRHWYIHKILYTIITVKI